MEPVKRRGAEVRRIFLLLIGLAALPGWVHAAPQAAPQTGEPAAAPDRADSYYRYTLAHLYEQLARAHGNRGYLSRALEEYEKTVELDPESIYPRLRLVDLYARTNRLEEAREQASIILERDPENLEVRRLLGRIYQVYSKDRRGNINDERLRDSIRQYEEILEIASDDEEALLQLAELYRTVNEGERAEQMLNRLLELKPESAEAWSSLARLALEDGNTEGAIEALEKVRGAGRARRDTLVDLARAYDRAGRHKQAAEIFRELLGRRGPTGPYRPALANSLVMAGELDEALEQYNLLVEVDPGNPEYHLRLSQIHREKRNWSAAREHLEKAASLAPESLEVKYNAVLLLEAEGKSDQAVAAMKGLLDDTARETYSQAEKRNRVMFLEQLGLLHRSAEQFEQAEAVFLAMAELDPDALQRVYMHRVDIQRAARRHDRARRLSAEAVKRFPDNLALIVLRANVLAETGDVDKAAKLLKAQLKNEPADRDIHLSLVQVYEKGKRFDAAIEAVNKADALSKTEREKLGVLFSHASVLERAKRYGEAEEKFRALLKLDPDNGAALNYLGYMLADRNVKLDEAHDFIHKALDLDPNNGAYLDSLGWLYYRQDKLDLAERFLLRSVDQYKTDPIVLDHLGDVYHEQGRASEAKQQWQRSLEEWRRSPKSDQDPSQISNLRKKLANLKNTLSADTGSKDGSKDNSNR